MSGQRSADGRADVSPFALRRPNLPFVALEMVLLLTSPLYQPNLKPRLLYISNKRSSMPLEIMAGSLFGILIGAGIAWAIVTAREKASRTAALGFEFVRTASAEALLEETRQQLRLAQEEAKFRSEDLRKHQSAWITARTRLAETEKNLKEQKALLDHAESRLSETFRSLAAQSLAMNNKGFLTLAEERFKTIKSEAKADLDARKVSIEALVKPVSESLILYQNETKNLEEKRLKEIGAVSEQLRSVAETQCLLQTETNRLVNALKSPQTRGRWGEITLRRTAELAGMSIHRDFTEQESVCTESGRFRPDMLVRLPAGRAVVVDSKVPLAAFLEALEAPNDEQRILALDKHAKHVSCHVDKLSSKEYWGQFASVPEFVILFIPNDTFLAAAAERDPELIESAMSKKIVITTPTTLVALLRAIEYGWRQQNAVDNALHISQLGQELSDRYATLVDHLKKVGAALGKAVDSYNSAVGTCESRILPSARRFKTLGAVGIKEIAELQLVEPTPRSLANADEPTAF